MTKNKKEDNTRGYRNREGETLFIDARNMGTMIDRTQKELTKDDITHIANTYHAWRNTYSPLEGAQGEGSHSAESDVLTIKDAVGYQDIPGYCKSATLEDIKANDYVLTPGRYVGVAEEEDDPIVFEEKMTDLTATLRSQLAEAQQLDADIRENLKLLGYE